MDKEFIWFVLEFVFLYKNLFVKGFEYIYYYFIVLSVKYRNKCFFYYFLIF